MNDLVRPGRSDGAFVFLLLEPTAVVRFGSNVSSYLVFPPCQKHLNGDDRCVFILVEPMDDLAGPGRTARAFVFICLTLVVLSGFDAVRGHNLTLILDQNILQWQ